MWNKITFNNNSFCNNKLKNKITFHYHISGHYPPPYILLKTQRFGDWAISISRWNLFSRAQ
jgi:hypothetical protein